MQQILKDWAPALALFIGLGGLQLTLYDGLRADLGGRMGRLEVRLDNLESGFTDMRERLARVEVRLDNLESGFADMRERLARVEVRLDNLESGFADMRKRLARLETHLTIPTSATDPASMAAN